MIEDRSECVSCGEPLDGQTYVSVKEFKPHADGYNRRIVEEARLCVEPKCLINYAWKRSERK